MSPNPQRLPAPLPRLRRRRLPLAAVVAALALVAPGLGQRGTAFSTAAQVSQLNAELVAEIRPGTTGSLPGDMAVFNGSLYFTANDGTNGNELWRLDANAAAPVMVDNIVPGPGSSSPSQLTVAGGVLYFRATTSGAGFELWKYDGVSAPALAADINPGAGGSFLTFLTAFGNQIVFRAFDGTDGEEPFAYDPAVGLKPLDVNKSCVECGSDPYGFMVHDGRLYFGASEPVFGTELYSYDGATTTRLTDGPFSPTEFIGVGGRLVYAAGLQVTQLRSHEIATGDDVEIVLPSVNFFGPVPRRFARMNGVVYFTAQDDDHGRELWVTDGTAAGTSLVDDIFAGPTGSDPRNLTPFNGELVFSATDAASGHELRATTGSGSRLIADLASGPASSGFDGLTVISNLLFFVSTGGGSTLHPWVTDGTSTGTEVIRKADGQLINPTGDSMDDTNLTPFNGALYFPASSSGLNFELWKIAVGGSNQAPLAVATAPATVTADATCAASVTLDGTGSSDPDGDTLGYSWTENGNVLATTANPTISLGVGTHTIRLTVTDPQGASNFDEVTVTVDSTFQVAYVGPALLQAETNNDISVSVFNGATPIQGATVTVTINGVASQPVTDQNGIAKVGVGPVPAPSATVTIDYATACGLVSKTVSVPVNRRPTASPGGPSPVFAGPNCTASVALAANAADPDGDTLTYQWSEGGSTFSAQANPTVSLAPGLHTINLLVSDGKGGSASGSVAIDVRKALTGLDFVAPLPQFTVGVAAQVSAKLVDSANAPIAGATLVFSLTGSSASGTTDASGIATVSLTPGNNGIQELTVSYAGDSCREPVTFKTNVTVARPTATIIVQKIVVNDDGGQLQAPAFSMSVSSPGDTKTIAGDAAGIPVTVNAGAYSVTETLNPDYNVSYSTDCNGTTIAGDTKTCVITNDDKPATLTLIKSVTNDNGGLLQAAAWTLRANGQAFVQNAATEVQPGSFTLTEEGPAGYDASPWSCSVQVTNGTITVPPHRAVTCTITNDDRPATLTLTKIVANDNGGTATASSWQLTAGVTAFASGVSQSINAGTYTLAESSGPSGYAAGPWLCQGGLLNGNQLTLALGEIASCSITNSDLPGTLNVSVQIVTNSGGPAAVPGDVTVTVTGNAPSPSTFSGSAGTAVTLNAGPYSVGASQLTGYTSSMTGECAGTLALGGSKTCTLIFDDDPPPQQRPPTANSQSVQTDEDTALQIQLTGSDPDGDPLSYILVAGPTNGVLTGAGAALVYTPKANVNGPDSFTFKVNDGFADSNVATISINVLPVNDPPTATPQTLTTPKNTPLPITLSAIDPDNTSLIFAIATGPAHGTIQGTGAGITYVPDANYVGPDSFTFTASDGVAAPSPATVSITVTNTNTAPVADSQSVSTPAGTPRSITLTASDVDGNTLSFVVLTPPAHGTLSGNPPDLTYTPAAGYTGPDSLTFKANDGLVDSNVATVSITVTPINADLTLQLIDLQDPVTIGQPLSYLVRLINNGPDFAANPIVTVTLPAGVSYSATAPCTGTTTLTCQPGPLAPGTERPFTIVVVPQVAGQISATAYVPDLGNPDDADNTATASTFVEKASTSTSLSSAPNPSTFGNNVTLTAGVTGLSPTGTVTFRVDGVQIGTSPLVNGVATLTTSALATGTRSLTASYGGDGNNLTSTASAVQHVVQPIVTSTTLASGPNPSTAGQPVTFTATVTGGSPTGVVTFQIVGGAQLGQATVVNRVATLTTSALAAGSYSIAASYTGDTNHAPSTSAPVSQQVGLAPTTTRLDIEPNPAAPGASVLLKATVTGFDPSGSVTFFENNTVLATAPVINGVATLPITQGKKGSRAISASYPGDANNLASASPKVKLTTK